MPGMEGFLQFDGTLRGSVAGGAGGNVTDVKVRDSQETTFESVVNEQGVAEIDLISYVRRNELNQAIQTVENNIDNVEQLVDTKQNIINFSSTEQNTGLKWIDGKDIYTKTYNLTIPNQSGVYLFPNTDIENLNEVVNYFYSLNGSGQVSDTPWYSTASIYFAGHVSTGLSFYFTSNYNSGANLKYTAFYTKN